MNRLLVFWVAVGLMTVGVYLVVKGRSDNSPAVGTAVETDVKPTSAQQPPLTDWELIDQHGKRVASRDFAGRVWGGSFFFVSCPSTCFNQNVRLQQLQSEFGDRGLELVSITCDPANDTPAALMRYATRFNADTTRWHFLTPSGADVSYVSRIAQDFFGLAIGPGTHSSRLVVFDQEGNRVGAYNVLDGIEFTRLREKLDELLGAAPSSEPSDD